jgi:hypothetical protein
VVLSLIKGFFGIYWEDQVVFVFASINVLYYIYWFSCVQQSLHPWDEAILIMVDDLSDVLLDSVWHYFIEDFDLVFIKEIGLQFSFLEVSLSGLEMNVTLAS